MGTCANASCNTHAELDDGNSAESGEHYKAIRQQMGQLSVLGGCCGTDHRHIEATCKAAISA